MENKKKIIPVLSLLFIVLFSFQALALDDIIYSPFSETGGWSAGSTWGRNRAFDYDDILFVANGNDIYKYDMSTWEYLGAEAFTYDINDLKLIGSNLYITQNDEVWKYTVSGETLTYTSDYWNFSGSTLYSFDVDLNETKIVASDSTSTCFIKDLDTSTVLTTIGRSNSDMVRFSWDGEVVLIADIGAWQNGIFGHAASNGASLFTHTVASNYLKSMAVSLIDDQFLSGWSYGFSDYDIYQRNFSANTDAGIRSWTGYKFPHKGAYSQDGTLLTRMQTVDGLKSTTLHYVDDGVSLGSFTPAGTNEYSEWSYIPTSNRYIILGTVSQFYVVNTGVAPPLITTIASTYQYGNTADLSMAVNDPGDATNLSCTVEYRELDAAGWSNIGNTDVDETGDFPTTLEGTATFTDDIEYRAKCTYYLDTEYDVIYGQVKQLSYQIDYMNTITDNLGVIVGLIILVGMIGTLAVLGITNLTILMVIAIIADSIMWVIGLFSTGLFVLILVAGIVLALLGMVIGGKE